ncbi:MAG: hypothetical protein IT576_20005 [Verrucomicrobiales bacterium]|nr:hypothetical protein [Verrucomicrobiales bacterium]
MNRAKLDQGIGGVLERNGFIAGSAGEVLLSRYKGGLGHWLQNSGKKAPTFLMNSPSEILDFNSHRIYNFWFNFAQESLSWGKSVFRT